MVRHQVHTWDEAARGLLRTLEPVAPGSTYTLCMCRYGPCQDHTEILLRNLFPDFLKFLRKQFPDLLVWDPCRLVHTVSLQNCGEMLKIYRDRFRNQYNNWLRNRSERLGPKVSTPFEELDQQDYDLVSLPDIEFREKYYVPERTWTWAQTVQAARGGLVEPRPYPTLKSDRPSM